MNKEALILANFGGPRDQGEVKPFLKELLLDYHMTGNNLPKWFHKCLFSLISAFRTKSLQQKYHKIGDHSPLYARTESLARTLEQKLCMPVITFHRYIPATHQKSLDQITSLKGYHFTAFPLFPHFSFTVVGSIVDILLQNLPKDITIDWIPDFGTHPLFLDTTQQHIHQFLKDQNLSSDDTQLLFTLHSLPTSLSLKGDPYIKQCVDSFFALRDYFGEFDSLIGFQSQTAFSTWTEPFTEDLCKHYPFNKPKIALIPFGFVCDHIETLYEIEYDYLPLIRERGYQAFRVPSIENHPTWPSSIVSIIQSSATLNSESLIKPI